MGYVCFIERSTYKQEAVARHTILSLKKEVLTMIHIVIKEKDENGKAETSE